MLDRGARNFTHPFHWPALATCGGDRVNLRTVILRDFLKSDRILICHSDFRAPKVSQIQNNPAASWLFYHPKEKIQLRISGNVTLHTHDSLAEKQWDSTHIISRINYRTTYPPGTPIQEPASGLLDSILDKSSELLHSQAGRENFAVIVCRFNHMDWLILRATGHMRAQFTWDGNKLKAVWVVP